MKIRYGMTQQELAIVENLVREISKIGNLGKVEAKQRLISITPIA